MKIFSNSENLDTESSTHSKITNEHSYIFVNPKSYKNNPKEKSISDFLSRDGIFQINLGEMLKM